MTQLTQGSDMELREAILKAALVRSEVQRWEKVPGEPTKWSNQAIVEIGIDDLMQLIQADKQRSIDRALETLRQNLEPDLFGHDYERLVDEINNLSPTTTEGDGHVTHL